MSITSVKPHRYSLEQLVSVRAVIVCKCGLSVWTAGKGGGVAICYRLLEISLLSSRVRCCWCTVHEHVHNWTQSTVQCSGGGLLKCSSRAIFYTVFVALFPDISLHLIFLFPFLIVILRLLLIGLFLHISLPHPAIPLS